MLKVATVGKIIARCLRVRTFAAAPKRELLKRSGENSKTGIVNGLTVSSSISGYVKGENVMEPGIPESFELLIKELQSLALDVKVLTETCEQIGIKIGSPSVDVARGGKPRRRAARPRRGAAVDGGNGRWPIGHGRAGEEAEREPGGDDESQGWQSVRLLLGLKGLVARLPRAVTLRASPTSGLR